MLSNQKPSDDKLVLGFISCEASTSKSKKIKFVKSQKEIFSGGGLANILGGKAIKGPLFCSPESEKSVSFQKSILGPRPKYKMVNNVKILVARCEITKDGKVIGRCIRKKGLYVMKLGNKPEDKMCLATINENFMLWHKRLGHANMHLIQSLASKKLVRNLPKLKFDQHFCNACKIGKQTHASHKAKNIVTTTRCLELLYMDLFGPSAIRSYAGKLYTLFIVDEYSRTDYSRELDNEVQFGEFCNANGITHNFLAPHTPQSNGMVDKKNRTLQQMSRTMTSPLVDDDLDEEEAIKVTEKRNLENNIEDEILEIDEIVNIKESKNHPLENVIGNLNQRTLISTFKLVRADAVVNIVTSSPDEV
nr:retrovirus-related Pol polyprotein from transposon TNT 1-94 [Tanacetum cinerariifolium]